MISTMTYDGGRRSMLMKSHRSRSVLISESDPLPGDHIYVKGSSRFYKHHGIYIGHGKVIHVSGSIREKVHPEVRETDLSSFLKDGVPRRRVYEKRLPASETIRIAKEQLRSGSYSMVWNNCENFATYCVRGKKKSLQVRKIIYGLSTVTAGIAILVLTRAAFHR